MKKLLFLFILLIAGPAYAVPRGTVAGDLARIDRLFRLEADDFTQQSAAAPGTFSLPSVISLRGRIDRIGAFVIRFDTLRQFAYENGAQPDYRLLQGEATIVGENGRLRAPASATIGASVAGKRRVKVFIVNKGFRGKQLANDGVVSFSFVIKVAENGELQAGNVTLPKRRLRQGARAACGVSSPARTVAAALPAQRRVRTQAEFQTVGVVVDGDTAWNSVVDNFSESLAEMMNTAEVWYKRDLSIAFDVTINSTPENYSSAITLDSNYSYPLHEEMRDKRPADSRSQEIHYLATGKTPAADQEGLAGVVPDLATICRSKSDSIGFTIFYPGNFTDVIVTTAHEIGHLFAAEHDDSVSSTQGYIMASGTQSFDSFVNSFSTRSQQQVSQHLAEYASCLGSESGETPDDGSGGDESVLSSVELTTRGGVPGVRRARLIARAYDQYGDLIRRGETLSLYCSLSEDGPFDLYVMDRAVRRRRANFSVRAATLGDYVYCIASSSDGGVSSEAVQALYSTDELL